MVRLLTIVSGGQSGVDRGALDAALELGNPCGGWCPKDRAAEDGPIPKRYPMHQLEGGYAQRTRRNVAESDGTLILYRGALSQGTRLALDFCHELGKPVCLVDADKTSSATAALEAHGFIVEHAIEKLNVAGPRESHWTHAHEYAFDAVHDLILRVWHGD